MKRLLLPILAALGCLSCAPPPFNLDLSMSARTAKALTMEGTVGPIDKFDGGPQVSDALFLPEKGTTSGLDLMNGFVLSAPPGGDRQLTFVWGDPATGMYRATEKLSIGIATVDPYPGTLLLTLKGTPHMIGGFSFSFASPGLNTFNSVNADPATGQFPVSPISQPLGSLAMPSLGMTGNVIAVSLYPENDPTQDSTYWLFKYAGGDQFMEARSPVNASPLAPPILLSTRPLYSMAPGMPVDLTRVLYYYDPEPTRAPERSFMSWYDDLSKRWRCWTWWGVMPSWQGQELPDVSHRIDALLTTGELLSTEGDVGRLYSRDGALRATFSLSGLKLIGEYFVNGTARVLFSQYLFYDQKAWFNVYSIPSAGLAGLAQ